MKKIFFAAFAVVAFAIFGQTSIDKPAATLKLTRLEVISSRLFKADIEKLESAAGKKLGDDLRRQVLENRINGMLFFQFCEREKILAPENEINAALSQLKANLGPGADDAKLEVLLRSQGILLDAKTYARQQILLKYFIQTKRADDLKSVREPTADDILKSYELLKSQLVRPDTVRVSVLYAEYRNMGAEEKKKAADAIKQASQQLRTAPGKFDELMLKASESGSILKATTAVLVEKTPQYLELYGRQFMDTVFGLKANDLSEIIENEAGIQIVRVNEVLPQKQLGLSDPVPGQPNATVQDLIKYNIAMERQNAVLQKIQDGLVAQLRKEATVKIYEENLKF